GGDTAFWEIASQAQWALCNPTQSSGSVREAEEGDVADLEDVFLALEAVFAGFAGGGGAAEARGVVEGNDLGLDEAFFEIGVSDACGQLGHAALLDGPGADLSFAGSEVGTQAEQVVAAADEGGDAGVIYAEALEEFLRLVGAEVDELVFDAGADGHVGGP